MAWTSLGEPEKFDTPPCDEIFLLIVLYFLLRLESSETAGALTAVLGQNNSY